MLKEYSIIINMLIACLDALFLVLAFILAYSWRSSFGDLDVMDRYLPLLYFSVPCTLFVFFKQGLYKEIRFDPVWRIAWKTLSSIGIVGIACSAALYLSHDSHFSRLLFGSYFVVAAFFILLEKIILILCQNYYRTRGHNLRNILLIGQGEKLNKVKGLIQQRPQWGLKIIKECDLSASTQEKVKKLLEQEVVDEVYVAFSRNSNIECDIGQLLALIERFGKVIKVAVNLDEELKISRIDCCKLGDLPALAFYSRNLDPDMQLLKRFMDITGSLVGLAITAVIFPFIAVAIKLDSKGPIFFGHTRVGFNGRKFTLYKFRSMSIDAESKKDDLKKANVHQGPIFKVDNDPRVTRVGRFLRRYSLDEFPQFFNVLKGDMSLVGTRPPTPDEVEEYQAWHYRRISIRPGITGIWQVGGRNKIENFDQIVEMDLKYINSWSLWLDIKLLLKTLWIFWQPDKNGVKAG